MAMVKARMMVPGCSRRTILSVLLLCIAVWTPVSRSATPEFFSASLAGLVDTSGRPLGKEPYKGKYRLVLFGFTSCADVCPLTLLAMRQAMQLLGDDAAQVVPIFISVDPERDQGEKLAKYVRAFDSRIQGLTGPLPALEKVAAGHGVFFEKRWVNVSNNVYVYDHTASILLIDPSGNLLSTVSSAGPTDDVAHRILSAFRQYKQPAR